MCDEGDLFVDWANVPCGSVLELWVEGECAKVTATADGSARPAGGEAQPFDPVWECDHAELCSDDGTVRSEHELECSTRYDVVFRVAFDQAGTVTKRARILRPDGSEHGTPWFCKLTREAGEFAQCRVMCTTKA